MKLMHFLLKKTHPKTGLNYLCKHTGTRKSCFEYSGSGTYWKRHLKKHDSDFLWTQVLFGTNSMKRFKQEALYYSKLWNIVESKKWANLCPEEGNGGAINKGKKLPNLSKAMKGKLKSETHKQNMSKNHADISGKNNPRWKGGFSAHYKRKLRTTPH